MQNYRKVQNNGHALTTLKEIDEEGLGASAVGFHKGSATAAGSTPLRTEPITQAVSMANTNRGGFGHANNNNV